MNKILKVMCFILFALFAGINTIYAQGQSPTGLVVDENGQPMIGVQIKIEGTTVGAITDVDGNFTIKAQKGKKHDGCSAQYARPTEFSQCPCVGRNVRSIVFCIDVFPA